MSRSKKPNLATALQEASGKAQPPVPQPETTSEPQETSYLAPSRRGKKAVTGHFDPAVSRQLKQIALDRDTTVQALLAEALNDLFEKYNSNPIA